MKSILFLFLAIPIVCLTGCAFGNKISAEKNIVDSVYSTSKNILTGFQDKRIMVIDGSQKPSFCGYTLAMGIHYPVGTVSGKDMAEEFTNSLVGSLQKQNINATPIFIKLYSKKDSLINFFKNSDKDRLVLIFLNEWVLYTKAEMVNMLYELKYDLEMQVFDKEGKQLATSTVSGTSELRKDMAVSRKSQEQATRETFNKQVRALFLNEGIKQSLQ